MQYQANSLIKQVNQFIDGSSADPIDKVGGAGADDEVYVQGPTTTTTMSEVGGIGNLIKSVPTMIGQAAVSVIRSVRQSQFCFTNKVLISLTGHLTNVSVTYPRCQYSTA